MIDIKKIREDFDATAAQLARRGVEQEKVAKARDLDAKRRALIGETETLKQQRNSASKEIGAAAKAGQDISAAKEKMRAIGDRIAEIDRELAQVEVDLRETLLMIPNIPAPEIPTGADSSANKVVRHVGEWKDPAYPIPDHTQIGERLGIFDFPRGVKLTGTGFPIILGQGAKLQRALIQYMLDLHCQKQGYTEMLPPFLVNSASMTGTGQLPKFAEDLYHSNADDFWLIPTAEVPVTNYYRDDVFDGVKLPKITPESPVKLTAYTPCFRREAGSAGKMTRGMLRVHQFDKVEMVNFVHPSTSFQQLETLVHEAEEVLTGLALVRRHGLLGRQVLRPRTLGPRRAAVAGSELLQLLHGLPGPPPELPVQGRGRQDEARAHAQRLGRGPASPHGGAPRAAPPGGRLRVAA